MEPRVLLVTGGAGFIGSNFVLEAVRRGHKVINLDALTYAGNMDNLASLQGNPAHTFVHGSILDGPLVAGLLSEHRPDALVHFAAESHVDRSILGPAAFVDTNIIGTFTLLEAALKHLRALSEDEKASSASCMCRRTRSMDRLRRTRLRFTKRRLIGRIVLTLRPRRRPITWCGPISIPMVCPC